VALTAIEDVQLWYHTLELPGGVLTPGWFDLRAQAERLPWPDVRGKRCLDVGTYDGFYAFELERRGAAEVVATDISDHAEWDWPAAMRAGAPADLAAVAGDKGQGFEVARAALASKVRRIEASAYHLDPDELGRFDVVVCGSLMVHLRDPVRALEAIRSVCDGWFMSVESVSLWLSLRFPRTALAELRFDEQRCQWWEVNAAGHRKMVTTAGFEVTRTARTFIEPFGTGHPSFRARAPRWRPSRRGVPHAALLARPRLQAPPIRV
jgi:tRNA (mo5U34)-methyltransferase